MSRVNEGSYVIAYHNEGNNASLNCKHCKVKFFIGHYGFITKAKYNTKGKAMQAMHRVRSKNSFSLFIVSFVIMYSIIHE